MEAFLNSLPRAPMGIAEECPISRTGYNLGPTFGTGRLGLNRWNCKLYSINMLNSGLICTRDFSFFKNEPKNILLKHKAFGWTHEQSRKQLKRSFMTKCKLPLSNKPAPAMSDSTASSSPSRLSSLKSYSFIEKYFLPPLPGRHESSVSLLRSALCPKPIEKSSSSKKCYEKGSQFLKHSESLKSLAPSSKYLKRLKLQYLLQKLPSPSEPCKQYPSFSTFYSSCPHLLSQDVSRNIQEAPKRLSKSQRNKTHKTSVYRGPCYPISLHRIYWRGFHSSLFPFAKSDSNKPSTCKEIDEICKPTEVKKTDESGRRRKEKSVYRQEKVKCDKSQVRNKEKARQKPKLEKKVVDPACRKTCLPIGKCELPRTVPPPKMEYAEVTCPPPKFAKPKPCPLMPEHFQKDDKSHIEIKQINVRKKQICAPPPLPKPPYAPVALCPCPPPRKVHPGPCPFYETKKIAKRQPSIQPCKLKKKYPCPTAVHYCPPYKKPCNLKRETGCDRRMKKEASTS
ncbi:uncharacterized protein LOC143899392 [Temnothorax americanus]|uniref:uncharacterized protein LOC143899392 n=1 Tax=Temnothorax americanus TaxID=1964332 RepID=UPI004067D363